jgi:HSP20 family molecular chaperone IbpA
MITLPDIPTVVRRQQQRYYRPFVEEYRNMMNRSLTRSSANSDSTATETTPWAKKNLTPPYDIIETDTAIQIAMDVPGIEMNEFSITLDDKDQILSISGRREQKTTTTTKDNKTYRRAFTQKFALKNPQIDTNEISAQLHNGVLTITIPKKVDEPVTTNVRTIPIVAATVTPAENTVDIMMATDTNNNGNVTELGSNAVNIAEDHRNSEETTKTSSITNTIESKNTESIESISENDTASASSTDDDNSVPKTKTDEE